MCVPAPPPVFLSASYPSARSASASLSLHPSLWPHPDFRLAPLRPDPSVPSVLSIPIPVLSSRWSQVGSFFMINLCLVVIATQFSETKQREHRLMLEQRQRYLSSSTVASYAEPGDCYEEIFQYVCHILRKAKRRALGLYQALQSRRQASGPAAPACAKPAPQAKEPRHFSKWPCLPWPPGCRTGASCASD